MTAPYFAGLIDFDYGGLEPVETKEGEPPVGDRNSVYNKPSFWVFLGLAVVYLILASFIVGMAFSASMMGGCFALIISYGTPVVTGLIISADKTWG